MKRPMQLVRNRLVQMALALGCVAIAVGLAAFEPWKLWVDKTVVEALPAKPAAAAAPAVAEADEPAAAAPQTAEAEAAEPEKAAPGAVDSATPERAKASASKSEEANSQEKSDAPAAKPVAEAAFREIARGTLITHEHGTTGTVRVLRLADGSRVLRFENLNTSNGPDLKVVLSDGPVIPGRAGWHVFDDGKHTSIGNLKGNKGSQNYTIPTNVDLGELRSVSIWCDRFNVSFGAAALKDAG